LALAVLAHTTIVQMGTIQYFQQLPQLVVEVVVILQAHLVLREALVEPDKEIQAIKVLALQEPLTKAMLVAMALIPPQTDI
jgi:hypothetical protein